MERDLRAGGLRGAPLHLDVLRRRLAPARGRRAADLLGRLGPVAWRRSRRSPTRARSFGSDDGATSSSATPAARRSTSGSSRAARSTRPRRRGSAGAGSGHITGIRSVDVKSIGAGGGSIVWIDPGGLLRVGPRSAGADPGPACYGRGGTEPTVTDAAVVLGWIDPDVLPRRPADARRRGRAAGDRADVAEPLGLSVEEAALRGADDRDARTSSARSARSRSRRASTRAR